MGVHDECAGSVFKSDFESPQQRLPLRHLRDIVGWKCSLPTSIITIITPRTWLADGALRVNSSETKDASPVPASCAFVLSTDDGRLRHRSNHVERTNNQSANYPAPPIS